MPQLRTSKEEAGGSTQAGTCEGRQRFRRMPTRVPDPIGHTPPGPMGLQALRRLTPLCWIRPEPTEARVRPPFLPRGCPRRYQPNGCPIGSPTATTVSAAELGHRMEPVPTDPDLLSQRWPLCASSRVTHVQVQAIQVRLAAHQNMQRCSQKHVPAVYCYCLLIAA